MLLESNSRAGGFDHSLLTRLSALYRRLGRPADADAALAEAAALSLSRSPSPEPTDSHPVHRIAQPTRWFRTADDSIGAGIVEPGTETARLGGSPDPLKTPRQSHWLSPLGKLLAIGVSIIVISAAGLLGRAAVKSISQVVKSDSVPAIQSTPAPVPAGWKSFSDGPFSGAIKASWSIEFVNAQEVIDERAARELVSEANIPNAMKDQMVKDLLNKKSWFFVFMEDPLNNINIQECVPMGRSKISGEQVKEEFLKNGVTANNAGSVAFHGRSFDLLRLSIYPTVDTYSTFLDVSVQAHRAAA